MCGCNKQKKYKKANFPAMPSAITKTLGKAGRLCRVLWPLHSANAMRLCRMPQVRHPVKPPCLCRVPPIRHSAKWPPLPSVVGLTLGKEGGLCRVPSVRRSAKRSSPSIGAVRQLFFAEWFTGTQQSLCRVPDKRHSAKRPLPSPALPSDLCRGLHSAKGFAECIWGFAECHRHSAKCLSLVVH